MSESLRDLLARGADTIERPAIDVEQLVTEAERRLVRRRAGTALAGAAAVAAIAAGMVAVQGDDRTESPAPAPSTESPDPAPDLGSAIYFDALAVRGDSLTDPARSYDGQKDIYVVHEGGPARQIIATIADERCPRVSPDGRMLAYLEGRKVVVRPLGADGNPGAATVRVSPDWDQGVTCPQWSPDGQRLAAGVQDYEAPNQVFEVLVIELDGTSRVLGSQRDQYMPLSEIAWSPDGATIAYKTPDSVWVVPLDGGEQERLWQSRPPFNPELEGFPPYAGMPTRLTWLVTGDLAVSTQTEVDGDERLYAVDPDSGRASVLGTVRSSGLPAVWSPDGSTLAFEGFEGGAWTFDLASGATAPLRPRHEGRELLIWGPVWSADGRRLLATAARAGNDDGSSRFALVSMNPDGSSVDVLTPWTMALYSTADASWAP